MREIGRLIWRGGVLFGEAVSRLELGKGGEEERRRGRLLVLNNLRGRGGGKDGRGDVDLTPTERLTEEPPAIEISLHTPPIRNRQALWALGTWKTLGFGGLSH